MKLIFLPVDSCADLFAHGHRSDGLYTIRTPSLTPFPNSDGYSQVWCDMEGRNGGWLVFQQRINNSVNFYRDWISYEHGFGQQGFNFWLGNRVLSALTLDRDHTLQIETFLVDGRHVYAEYDRFRLSFKRYTLLAGRYRGNLSDFLFYANNSAFSTWDRDNDKVLRRSCAQLNRGAW